MKPDRGFLQVPENLPAASPASGVGGITTGDARGWHAEWAAGRRRFLFVYGTLCDDAVLAAVLGRRLPPQPRSAAWLPDHRCVRISGVSYPRVVPAPGQVVCGRLVRGLTAADWRRIADFEGDRYRFRRIQVWCEDRWVEALYCAFVGASASLRSWDFASWHRRDRPAYLARVRRLMRGGRVRQVFKAG